MADSPAYRDRLPQATVPEGETLIATFRPDRARYIRDHVNIAGAGIAVAMIVLLLIGRGEQLWTGFVGVVAAIGLRGLWFYRDVMRQQWLLTDRALIAPGPERFELSRITSVRRLLGDVQVTAEGRRTLIKHQARAGDVRDQIEQAAERA
ncbi:MAG: hypothetical protein Q4G36_11485 [Paracoccus sp. (in: a-proteobacteria)]|nr:hypothetical protein [Paracoccus sp. (in: a-proteobacteria)]